MSLKLSNLGFIRNARGATAVEFALITPAIMMLFMGIVSFGFMLCVYSALQQIAGEAARASVAGLSVAEQTQIATQYVSSVLPSYGFLAPNNLSILTTSNSSTFEVTLTYDAGGSYFANFGGYIPTAPFQIVRSATVSLSGF